MVLAEGFLLIIAGPEDGGVKASPVPSDPEKPGTPGEGMLSSDLDRIPTEGEAYKGCLLLCPTCGMIFSGGKSGAPSLAMTIC